MGMGSHRAGGPEPGTTRPRRERIRWAAASVALAALPAALIVVLSGGTSSSEAVLSADYVRTGSWATGYSGQYVLRNDGADTVKGWTLRFDLPQGTRIANVWNGRLDQVGAKYTVRNENWNKALRPGESIVVGFEVRREDPVGAPAPAHTDSPLACTINDKPCQDPVNPTIPRSPAATEPAPATGSASVPRNTRGPDRYTPAPTGSSTRRPGAAPSSGAPTTPAPTTMGGAPTGTPSGAAEQLAPYLDLTQPAPFDPVRVLQQRGLRDWTLAWIVDGGGCRPMWGGVTRLDDPAMTARITALREAGATIRVGFGGSGGTDLAAACASPRDLALAYRQVLDATRTNRIDLDVEGRSLVGAQTVQRRNAALRLLQDAGKAAGNPVHVTYTLPVDPTLGLSEEAKELLRDAAAQKVDVEYVDIKALNYGAALAPRPDGRMGQFAIDAARTVHAQIRDVWPHLTDEAAWSRVSVSVMIGRNDVPGEVFTLDDARRFTDFAKSAHLGRIAWWAPARERPCGEAATAGDPGCGGISPDIDAFLRILGG
jgi:hypothetical protein